MVRCKDRSENPDQEGQEVLRMSQWAEIRHMHLVDGVAKKEVARRLGLDVKTVRRALEQGVAPRRRSSSRRPRRLDGCRDRILELLQAEPKITAKRIGRVLGQDARSVGQRALREYVAELRRELRGPEVFVHRTHRPGETMEVDFFETWAVVAGELRKVRCFVAVLPASNVYFAKAYPIERLECLLDGILSALEFFGGVPRRVVLDNTSLAVRRVLAGVERVETRDFAAFRGCFPLHVDFCAPGKGWEKGSVERGAEYTHGSFFRPRPEAVSWDELNAMLVRELDADLDHRRLPDGRTVRQAWIAEREHLRPLPPHRPETCRVVACVADKYGIVRVDRASYSVDPRSARRALVAKLWWDRVEIFDGDRCAGRHRRLYEAGTMSLDPLHVLPVLERKPRAAAESTALQNWALDEAFHRLREVLRSRTRRSDREWVRVLRLCEEHPMEDVTRAVELALERGSPTYETVRMLLRQASTPALEAGVVAVHDERAAAIVVPAADLSGYDALMEVRP